MRAQFQARLAALEEANRELHADVAGFARATREAIDSLADQRVDLSRERREELCDLKGLERQIPYRETKPEVRFEAIMSAGGGTMPHAGRATDPHGHRLFGTSWQSYKEGLNDRWWRTPEWLQRQAQEQCELVHTAVA
jgi:hypothetical protein